MAVAMAEVTVAVVRAAETAVVVAAEAMAEEAKGGRRWW